MAQSRQQSEFDMAVSYLNRLNYTIYLCDEASYSMNMYNWFHSCMILCRELSTSMNKADDVIAEDFINEIEPLLSKYNSGNAKPVFNRDLYKKIHDFEKFLRKILAEAGLEKKMKQDLSQALLYS